MSDSVRPPKVLAFTPLWLKKQILTLAFDIPVTCDGVKSSQEVRKHRSTQQLVTHLCSTVESGGTRYLANRRTQREIGSPITTMCTTNPRIRS